MAQLNQGRYSDPHCAVLKNLMSRDEIQNARTF